MLLKISPIILLTLLALASCNQTNLKQKSKPLSEGTPESVGMSTERLARIDSMCNAAVSESKIPGAVALVVRDGKIVYYKAFGKADNPSGRAMKRDDIFRIASQTKAITATAVMMLWEEGKFKLDDPISRYIPEFKNPQVLNTFNRNDTSYTTVPAKSEITIRQLLSHTSGIGYGQIADDIDEHFRMLYQKTGVFDSWTTKEISTEDNIKKLAKLPLHFSPGEQFLYSNGPDVLGYLIEVVSGQSLDVFLRTRIFEPLGMNDTWFYLPEDRFQRLVSLQMPENGKWVRYPITFYDPNFPVNGPKQWLSGGAGLSSTAKDYAAFLQMYLNGGEYNGKRFLSRTTIQTIMADQTGNLWSENGENYYGLAFSVVTKKGQDNGGVGCAGTFGWGGHFSTEYFADPKEKTIGIFMKQTQGADNDDTDWKFQMLVGQAITE
jgi:CubicO group peptidase (beta-lactamase class C family)